MTASTWYAMTSSFCWLAVALNINHRRAPAAFWGATALCIVGAICAAVSS